MTARRWRWARATTEGGETHYTSPDGAAVVKVRIDRTVDLVTVDEDGNETLVVDTYRTPTAAMDAAEQGATTE